MRDAGSFLTITVRHPPMFATTLTHAYEVAADLPALAQPRTWPTRARTAVPRQLVARRPSDSDRRRIDAYEATFAVTCAEHAPAEGGCRWPGGGLNRAPDRWAIRQSCQTSKRNAAPAQG